MTCLAKTPVQLHSAQIRHSDRIALTVEGTDSIPEALRLIREWAEDVARHEGMAPEVTETAEKSD